MPAASRRHAQGLASAPPEEGTPSKIQRRHLLGAAAISPLPRSAIAQNAGPDRRPSITIAVQIVSISGTLEPMREQSSVGVRIMPSFSEPLIGIDWLETERAEPVLATAWRRIDARTLELTLRDDVRMHDGRMMEAEDVAFTFGQDRMWTGLPADNRGLFVSTTAGAAGKTPPPEAVAISRAHFLNFERMEVVDRRRVRFVNAVPDVTLEGRLTRTTGAIFSRAAFAQASSWLEWARKPIGTGPYRVASFRPGQDLVLEAHDEYWGGRPPLRRIRFVQVPDVSARVAGLMALTEREDPAYTVLFQTANFAGKRKDLPWRASKSFVMDFSQSNWGGVG